MPRTRVQGRPQLVAHTGQERALGRGSPPRRPGGPSSSSCTRSLAMARPINSPTWRSRISPRRVAWRLAGRRGEAQHANRLAGVRQRNRVIPWGVSACCRSSWRPSCRQSSHTTISFVWSAARTGTRRAPTFPRGMPYVPKTRLHRENGISRSVVGITRNTRRPSRSAGPPTVSTDPGRPQNGSQGPLLLQVCGRSRRESRLPGLPAAALRRSLQLRDVDQRNAEYRGAAVSVPVPGSLPTGPRAGRAARNIRSSYACGAPGDDEPFEVAVVNAWSSGKMKYVSGWPSQSAPCHAKQRRRR